MAENLRRGTGFDLPAQYSAQRSGAKTPHYAPQRLELSVGGIHSEPQRLRVCQPVAYTPHGQLRTPSSDAALD